MFSTRLSPTHAYIDGEHVTIPFGTRVYILRTDVDVTAPFERAITHVFCIQDWRSPHDGAIAYAYHV